MPPPQDGDLFNLTDRWTVLANIQMSELILLIINLEPTYEIFLTKFYNPYIASYAEALSLTNNSKKDQSNNSIITTSAKPNDIDNIIKIITQFNIPLLVLFTELSDMVFLNNVPPYNSTDPVELAPIRTIQNILITINNYINTIMIEVKYKLLVSTAKQYFTFFYNFLYSFGHIFVSLLYQVRDIAIPNQIVNVVNIPNIKNVRGDLNKSIVTKMSTLNKLISYYNNYKYYIYSVIFCIVILIILLIF